jgi:hypothetical protein
VTLPAAGAGVSPGSFFLLVRVNGVGDLATLNRANGALLTPIPVTLVG